MKSMILCLTAVPLLAANFAFAQELTLDKADKAWAELSGVAGAVGSAAAEKGIAGAAEAVGKQGVGDAVPQIGKSKQVEPEFDLYGEYKRQAYLVDKLTNQYMALKKALSVESLPKQVSAYMRKVAKRTFRRLLQAEAYLEKLESALFGGRNQTWKDKLEAKPMPKKDVWRDAVGQVRRGVQKGVGKGSSVPQHGVSSDGPTIEKEQPKMPYAED